MLNYTDCHLELLRNSQAKFQGDPDVFNDEF